MDHPLLHPLTAVSQNLEIADRALPDFKPGNSADQISRYLEAQDDIEEGRESKRTSLPSRLGRAALNGAGIGAIMGTGKAGLIAGGGHLAGSAIPIWMAAGTGLGALAGVGSQGLQEVTRGPRLKKARGTIRDTPGWIERSVRDPELGQAGQAYKEVRRAPIYGAEAGLTAGGFLGAGLGAYLADHAGPRASLYGMELPISQHQSTGAAVGSTVGGLGLGALGLLAGLLIKSRRKRELLDKVVTRAGRKETGL